MFGGMSVVYVAFPAIDLNKRSVYGNSLKKASRLRVKKNLISTLPILSQTVALNSELCFALGGERNR